MPIIKSAKKRVRVAAKATDRNRETKNSLKTAVKNFAAALKSKKGVSEAQSKVNSELDKAVKKGVMHKNKAARRKSQVATQAKSVGAKVEKSAKAAPKAAANSKKKVVSEKKAAPKAKSAAKKPAAKKAPAKKTAK